jgi:uncharacterized protein YcbX
MIVGKVREIWRYPVKSMAGEKLDNCAVEAKGIPGDRAWALRDEKAGEIRGAKYMPQLLQCSSRYRSEPDARETSHVDITLADGTLTGSDDASINSRLSALLGRAVSLCPLQPATDKAHYRRAQPGAATLSKLTRFNFVRKNLGTIIRLARLDRPTRRMFSREPGEPLPDFSKFPPELFEFTSPPGTYFDAYPIHLLTTASLAAMTRFNSSAAWDVRRFRPNFLIEMENDFEGLVESDWAGRRLRLGELVLQCEIPTARCGMTMQAQDGLPKDPTVLRSIVRDAHQNLGLYASPVNSGRVVMGDVVELL